MCQKVLNQAMINGFKFKQDIDCIWHIEPKTINEHWKLKFVNNTWLLFSGGVPQINLSEEEVIAFLKRHS
jgi:hypothetical protein